GWWDSVARTFDAFSKLGLVLVQAMTAALGGSPERVAAGFARPRGLSTLRFNRYPGRAEPVEISREDGAALACETHVDSGMLTVLHQDACGGLQVRGRDGCWHDVPPARGALVVNTGLAFQRLVGGRFAATAHRVLLDPAPRLSIPFFFEPVHDFQVTPAALGIGVAPSGEAVPYESFLAQELAKFPEYDRN
ncbi:MAG: isopenicillin N synthase family oxygenase, partial [Myxococcales bacterium]|nr:isopenicillin N synthase family oxygenase [Myxococcales bacterium]